MIAFVPDLMDRSRLSGLGDAITFVKTPDELAAAGVGGTVIVDLGRPGALEAAGAAAARGARVIGFAARRRRRIAENGGGRRDRGAAEVQVLRASRRSPLVNRQELAEALIGTFEDTQPDGVVVAAAVVDPEGVSYAASDPPAMGAVFEFGSITKALTGTLLAALVLRGDVALDSPIGEWLDAGPNADITVLQLATHSSGLARLAPNAFDHEGFDMADPYAQFTPDLAEAGLRLAERREEVGTYSNFGFQLLGLLLERAGRRSFNELMAAEVFAPLGMASAGVSTGSAIEGHDKSGNFVTHWSQPLPGAGGVEGTMSDLAELAAATMRTPEGPAGEALALATTPHRPGHNRSWGLGWVILVGDRRWHNGGTAGFSSTIVVDRKRNRAVALLANVGDLTGALDRAALLAVDDRDPSPARPQPPSTEPAGDEFAAAAKAFADALVAEDYVAAVARFEVKTAQKLGAEQLEGVWRQTLDQLGPVIAISPPMATSRPFGAAARVDITLERGALALHTAQDPSTAIIGVLLIGPDDPAPF